MWILVHCNSGLKNLPLSGQYHCVTKKNPRYPQKKEKKNPQPKTQTKPNKQTTSQLDFVSLTLQSRVLLLVY